MKEFKMDADNIVKYLTDAEKELMRIALEQKLQEYIKTNHGIYYQIVVENTIIVENTTDWFIQRNGHGVISALDTDFTVMIIHDKDFDINRICDRTRSYAKNILSDFRVSILVIHCTSSEYYRYSFRKHLSKTTTIPEKWFDINDQKLSKSRNKKSLLMWSNSVNTFIYENNIVYLNIGYVKYKDPFSHFPKYQKRKLFPLLYVNILEYSKISYIYDELKPIDGSLMNNECSSMYYTNKLHNYINNQIDTDKLYKKLNRLEPQIVFFFNCLFHRILDDEQIQFNKNKERYRSCFEACEFKLELTDDNTINFSYTDIISNDRIFIQLKKNSDTHIVETVLTRKEKTNNNQFSITGCYYFPITNNVFEYDFHIDNILSKLSELKFSPKSQTPNENTDTDLQDGNREIIEGEELNDIFGQIGK